MKSKIGIISLFYRLQMKGPQWLTQRELAYKRTGIINITGVNVDSLEHIGSRTSLKELIMSRTKLESIETLHKQPKLQKFIADNSMISTWKNFKAVSNASVISLKNTPLAEQKHFNIAAKIVCGENLTVLNGKTISNTVIEKAKTYPPFVADLLNAGWIFVYPCPDMEKLKEACFAFNIDFKDPDFEEPEESVLDREIAEPAEENVEEHYMDVLCSLLVKHSKNLDESEAKFDMLVRRYALAEGAELFQIQLKELLEKYAFQFDPETNLDKQLEDAVRLLVQ